MKAPGKYAISSPSSPPTLSTRQRGVEVVVARVDELEAHDRQAERLARFGVGARVGAEAGAGEEPLAGDEEVAFAFVDERGRLVVAEPGGAQPVEVRGTLSRALLVAELRAVDLAVRDGRAVRREDHVGVAGQRIDELDVVAQPAVGLDEEAPLPQRQIGVDRDGRVHPRVDRVPDVEVARLAHQVAAPGGVLLVKRAGSRRNAYARYRHRFGLLAIA